MSRVQPATSIEPAVASVTTAMTAPALDATTVDWSRRPVPHDGGPTQVRIMLEVESFKVETADNNERLVCVFNISLQWEDPRIIAAELDLTDVSQIPKDIWRPPTMFADGFA